jgi:heat-inducible transcriptional repressor
MAAEMTERRRLLLKLVIQEHIEHPEPGGVGSDTLVRKYGLSHSSATVRNELAALEELGFLTHWHTSAGRVPTDAGYRYFVENLMDRTPLSPTEQRTIRHQFYQVRTELDQWIQLAGAVLARTAQNVSVVTAPRAYQSRFKHLELISIHDTMVLLVLVLHDGTVRQQTLTIDQIRSQEELSRSAERINDRCYGAPVAQVEALLEAERQAETVTFDDLEQQVLELIVKAMRQLDEQFNEQIHSDGLIEILSQPEFMQIARVRQVLELLQSGKGVSPLIPQALAHDGVQVVIGGEHGDNDMREYSVVLSRYGITGEVAGVVGVIGPTRMAYPRTISTVRYISTVMSDLLSAIYGGSHSNR